jgi:integrase
MDARDIQALHGVAPVFTAGFCRICVIGGLLEHLPAEHVRRPSVSAELPTLGFTHLQFEALLTAARDSSSACDFALIPLLGLLGLRIFEATSAGVADLREEHDHRVLRVCGKGIKVVLIPLPPAVGRAIDKADRIPMLRHACHDRAPCWRQPAVRPDRCRPCGSANDDAFRPSPQEPRPPPELQSWLPTWLRRLTTPRVARSRCGRHIKEARSTLVQPWEKNELQESA